MKISRVLHAGYIFQSKETQILFDPIFENPFSKNCFAFPEVVFDLEKIKKLEFSAVFISHIHDDHCSFESLNLINKNTPLYIYTSNLEMISLIQELGFKNVHSIILDQEIKIGSLKVIPRKALNSEVDSIFEIHSQDCKVLNLVDSWLDPETFNNLSILAPWDLVLWPFQILREVEVLSPHSFESKVLAWPQEWIDQIKILNPKYLIPSSCQFRHENWSWYNKALFSYSYQDFFKIVNSHLPNTRSFKLNPGESIFVSSDSFKNEESLSWIKIKDSVDVDYEFDPQVTIPGISEIAKKFPPLNLSQKNRIDHFLKNELQINYSKMGPSQDRFFNKTRLWKLSIFDYNGIENSHCFQLSEDSILKLELNPEEFDWKTEISEFKLFQALDQGESLTSLYLRVYGSQGVDILEDPLIRILSFFDSLSYQKAQLKKIKTAHDLL